MSFPFFQPGTRWLAAVPWTGCIVALGLWLRCYHYLRDPSMWHDEAALALNVIGKSFAGLLGPLFHAEAAPPLFLWIEKAVTLIFDDSTYALRLVPFLASCASLLLMVTVSRRLLPARAAPWALLLFASSDNLLWHACEAKPYAVDVCCAVGLLALFVVIFDWPLTRKLILYSLLAPLVIFLVYPGCFLCGGLLVALFPAVWRSAERKTWLGYGLLFLVVAGAFAALLFGPIRAQRCHEMTTCWLDQFPPWNSPSKVPVWLIASTFEIGRYCSRPLGQVLIPLALAGAFLIWRRGHRALVAMMIVPIGLALVASAIGAYPYGGTRVLAYAAPAIILLAAQGFLIVLEGVSLRTRAGGVALAAIVLVPLGWTAYRVVVPWERADCYGASSYVLAHRRPTDQVAGNHWEYLYYFRNLGPALTPVVGAPRPEGTRLWLVTSGGTSDHHRDIARHLPPGDWTTLEQREFSRTTVFLLCRPTPDPGGSSSKARGNAE